MNVDNSSYNSGFSQQDLDLAIANSIAETSVFNQEEIDQAIAQSIADQQNKEREEKIEFEQGVIGYKDDYDLNTAIRRVKELSESAKIIGQKVCLFIGRTLGEPFPGFGQQKPSNETWISLDLRKVQDPSITFIPNKQLHLIMDMNDHKQIERIHKLFDKVIVDYSTLKFHSGGDQAWYSLGKLLKPQKDSQLITQDINFCMISPDAIRKYMPAEERNLPTHKLMGSKSVEGAKSKWVSNQIEQSLKKLQADGCFSTIEHKQNSPFPYMYHHKENDFISPNLDHFILSGPQPSLYKQPDKVDG